MGYKTYPEAEMEAQLEVEAEGGLGSKRFIYFDRRSKTFVIKKVRIDSSELLTFLEEIK
jgi:hypothetical protein